jgi:ZIP family zinc transporter
MILAATLTGAATAVGVVPFLVVGELSRRRYDLMLGFGAGLMLAAATLGLLPGALNGGFGDPHRTIVVVLGFIGGVALLSLMDRAIPHQHAGGHHGHVGGDLEHDDAHDHCHHDTVDARARHQGMLVLGAMTLHRIPEGFALGAGFANTGARPLGVLLSLAIGAQNMVEGAVMAAPLRRGGLRAARLVGLVALTGMAVPVGAFAGYFLAGYIAGALPAVLALAAGALIYLACNEIIPESHSHGNERSATMGLLAGFVFILVFQSLLGES